jgi:hypothetical protein
MKNFHGTPEQGMGWPFLGLCASFRARFRAICLRGPSQGAAMNDITNWMQSNWYEFGSLFAQFAFLIAAVWIGRKILKSMRATQQQFGALLRLSMTEGSYNADDPSRLSETAHESMAPARSSVVASPMLSPVTERPVAPTNSSTSYAAFEKPHRAEAPSLSDELSGRTIATAPMSSSMEDSTPYVAAPLTLPEDEHSGGGIAAAGRGVVRWLNTPMVSSSGSSPWRRVVRWLQAPARS